LNQGKPRPPPTADELFESSVDRDLGGTATAQEVEMLESDPHLWTACLKARHPYLDDRIAGRAGGWSVVNVFEAGGQCRAFAVYTRGMSQNRLVEMRARLVARLQRCRVLRRELAEEAMTDAAINPSPKAQRKERVKALEGLLLAALESTDAPTVHEAAREYVATYRRGVPLGVDGDA
jgi:hypothetical protein